jgi:hypothetical protein
MPHRKIIKPLKFYKSKGLDYFKKIGTASFTSDVFFKAFKLKEETDLAEALDFLLDMTQLGVLNDFITDHPNKRGIITRRFTYTVAIEALDEYMKIHYDKMVVKDALKAKAREERLPKVQEVYDKTVYKKKMKDRNARLRRLRRLKKEMKFREKNKDIIKFPKKLIEFRPKKRDFSIKNFDPPA